MDIVYLFIYIFYLFVCLLIYVRFDIVSEAISQMIVTKTTKYPPAGLAGTPTPTIDIHEIRRILKFQSGRYGLVFSNWYKVLSCLTNYFVGVIIV